jgi:hypothetical protein
MEMVKSGKLTTQSHIQGLELGASRNFPCTDQLTNSVTALLNLIPYMLHIQNLDDSVNHTGLSITEPRSAAQFPNINKCKNRVIHIL